MGNFNEVALGLGTLSFNGVDVGYLKENVNYKYSYEIEKFKTGVPRRLQGSVTKELVSELTAGVAQLNAENMAMALGGLTVTNVGSETTIADGANQERTFAAYGSSGLEAILLDGPLVNTLVVKDITEVTTYVAGDDYWLIPGTGITVGVVYANPAGAISTLETVRVSYKYTLPTGKKVKLGTQFSLQQATLEFVHERPQDGKLVTIKMWKASVNGNLEWNFQEDTFTVNNLTFEAVEDTTHADEPMGYVLFET